MGTCRWTVRFGDREHTIELEHGYWSGKRHIWVDGQPAHIGGGLFLLVWARGSRDVLELDGHTCEVVVRPNFLTNNYDYALFVDGDKMVAPPGVPPSEPPV